MTLTKKRMSQSYFKLVGHVTVKLTFQPIVWDNVQANLPITRHTLYSHRDLSQNNMTIWYKYNVQNARSEKPVHLDVMMRQCHMETLDQTII